MNTLILRLDVTGQPVDWLSPQTCALLYCRDLVAWEAGEHLVRLRGGRSRLTGRQSVLDLSSIVAARTLDKRAHSLTVTPSLNNTRLFKRDDYRCLYCGETPPRGDLTRDHVEPVSRGGGDHWENVVTACRACNQRKGDRRLSELGWRLLAVPYVPNQAEGLILANRRILADQMAYLRARAGRRSNG